MDIVLIDEVSRTNSESSSSSSDDEFDLINIIISSESSDDEDVRIKRIRIENFIETSVSSYSNCEFKSHFRMRRHTAYSIVDLFHKSLFFPKYLRGRKKINGEKCILVTLWYLGNQESLRQVSDRFNITESSVYRILNRVIRFILAISKLHISWPSREKAKQISEGFKRKQGIYGVIGAIDGSHISIKKPAVDQECYVNSKGYHSIILQAVVDDKRRFIDIFCGEAGSQHKARVLRKSSLYEKGENGIGFYDKYFVLGDSAYPSKNWLVPPFRDNGHLTQEQKSFNHKHSSTRIIVENALQMLKERFGRLYNFENTNLSFITKCVVASCVLHNICIDADDTGEEYLVNNLDDIAQIDYAIVSDVKQNDKRAEVFNSLFNN